MDLVLLKAHLEADSLDGREPFNSEAYREAVRLGRGRLKSLVGSADRSSFLALMALRQADPPAYDDLGSEARIAILVDALQHSPRFNTWGLPHRYWADPAKALIEEGKPAAAALARLLQDKRKATVWGSEEVVESERYQYRVCDYAWVLRVHARGDTPRPPVPFDPVERDKRIAEDAGR